MHNKPYLKKRSFHLKDIVSDAAAADIKVKLEQYTGVQSVEIRTKRIVVTYDLMQCTYHLLKSFVQDFVSLVDTKGINIMIETLLSFVEQNEYDHLRMNINRNYYVQQMYLSLKK